MLTQRIPTSTALIFSRLQALFTPSQLKKEEWENSHSFNNFTTDQFSEDKETSKDNDDDFAEKISNGAELSHLVETSSPFWDVIPISNPGVSSENWHTIMVQNHYKFDSTITPFSPREWHLVRNKKTIRVQFPTFNWFDKREFI